MIVFHQIVAAVLLLILTLWLQCAGVAVLITWLRRVAARDIYRLGPMRSAGLVVKSTVSIIVLHGLVILLWASFYRLRCLPSWELAFYFSSSSYATVGYGDVVLPSNWRLLGPLESMTGVLMCGLSVGILFALVTRLVDRAAQSIPERERLKPHSPLSVAGRSRYSGEQTHG
jgi:voltage-gated potassium channel